MSKRPLKPEEKRAWARVARTVRPRADQTPPDMPPLEDIAAPHTTEPRMSHSQATKPHMFAPLQRTSTPKTRTPPPIQNRGKERRIRRGQTPISATLDLHGHTQASAQSLLTSFLVRQQSAGAQCVLVITGKGRRGEGVLRRRLLDWLGTGDAHSLISGYAPAHKKHGGSGAWYLFLRQPRQT